MDVEIVYDSGREKSIEVESLGISKEKASYNI